MVVLVNQYFDICRLLYTYFFETNSQPNVGFQLTTLAYTFRCSLALGTSTFAQLYLNFGIFASSVNSTTSKHSNRQCHSPTFLKFYPAPLLHLSSVSSVLSTLNKSSINFLQAMPFILFFNFQFILR